MPVHDEVFVRRVLVLTDARLNQRSAFERRETIIQVLTNELDRGSGRRAVAGSGIEGGAAVVVGYFETAPVVTRNAIEVMRGTVLDPCGHVGLDKPGVARGYAEEEHFLTRGMNQVADHVRKNRAEPRTAGKHVLIRGEPGAI